MVERTGMISASLLLLTFVLPVVGHSAWIGIGATIPNFKLEDQKERTWSRANFSSKPALYVLCDRDAYEYVDNWTKRLVPKYRNSIHFVPVADVSTVPDFLKGYIRDRFDGEFSYPVLMDWSGRLVTALGLKAGYPTLVIADVSGVITYHAWGKGSASQVKRLEEKLDKVTES